MTAPTTATMACEVLGITFRELGWKTLIYFEGAVTINSNARWPGPEERHDDVHDCTPHQHDPRLRPRHRHGRWPRRRVRADRAAAGRPGLALPRLRAEGDLTDPAWRRPEVLRA